MLAHRHPVVDRSEDEAAPPPRVGTVGRLAAYGARRSATRLSDRERRRIAGALFPEGARFAPFAGRFASLMSLSVLIAVMGLLADSTAVVIGAMLVAPLMGPVLGVAAAIVMGSRRRVHRQLATVAVGSCGAVGLAFLASLVVPGDPEPLPGELIARTSPNLLDLGVALAAGAAGAYGQVRRQAADALIGVAVAVALVPPLAVVGICLELGRFQYALGAFLLFGANVAGIVFAAALAFMAGGLVPERHVMSSSAPITTGLKLACFAALLMVVPLHVGRSTILPLGDRTERVRSLTEAYLGDDAPNVDVVEVSVDESSPTLRIELVLTASGDAPAADDLASMLAGELGTDVEVDVQVVQSRRDHASVSGG
ncbi:MAG: DUF389 domain-containing protein [Acidimicrobiales bacterium]|nr:DUF389 domain-containing protein [Acidimicrobiales bacterium]